MTAKQANGEAARWQAGNSKRVMIEVAKRASSGKKFLLCRSNKATRKQLKTDGFGVIVLGPITLIRW